MSKIREYVGDMVIDVEIVDDIPKTQAGKRRVTISLLGPEVVSHFGRGFRERA